MTVSSDAPIAPERVADPPVHDYPPPREPDRRLSSLLTGLGMLLAGVAVGWLLFGSPAVVDEPAAPALAVPPIEEPAEVGEPVAEVAEAVLPSVVQIETPGGIGSGVVYESGGLILTAAHVVDGIDEVAVRLSNGDRHTGEVLGGDLASDIAVVKVDAVGLPPAPLATGATRVGQLAVAIGSPYGLDSTVTAGVVSAVNQAVGNRGGFQSLIQTDAAINPGNSGGALANRDGEVIGINVSIFSTTGGNNGVGFAVPIDVAAELADSIVSGEPISNAVLGILGTDAESGPSGALVTEVDSGSAAAQAGLAVGDVVISVDGVRVQGIAEVAAQIRVNRPGDEVALEVIRNGETLDFTTTLGSATTP